VGTLAGARVAMWVMRPFREVARAFAGIASNEGTDTMAGYNLIRLPKLLEAAA
jgi:hypothetical protein